MSWGYSLTKFKRKTLHKFIYIILWQVSISSFAEQPWSNKDSLEVTRSTHLYDEPHKYGLEVIAVERGVLLKPLRHGFEKEWNRVLTPTGQTGWILKKRIQARVGIPLGKNDFKIGKTSKGKRIIQRKSLAWINRDSILRKSERTSSEKLARLRKGLKVEILGFRSGRIYIETPGAKRGWVHAKVTQWDRIAKYRLNKFKRSKNRKIAGDDSDFSALGMENQEDRMVTQKEVSQEVPQINLKKKENSEQEVETHSADEIFQKSSRRHSLGLLASYANQISHDSTNGFGFGAFYNFKLAKNFSLGLLGHFDLFSEEASGGGLTIARKAQHLQIGPSFSLHNKSQSWSLFMAALWAKIKTDLDDTGTIPPGSLPAAGAYEESSYSILVGLQYDYRISKNLSIPFMLHFSHAFYEQFVNSAGVAIGESFSQQINLGAGIKYRF